MLNKKRIIAIGVVAVLCVGIFYFYSQNSEMDAGTVALIEKFESYSGKLTPAEQQEFFETVQMLEAKHQNHGLPKGEATRLGLHLMELYRINPELWDFTPDHHAHDTDFSKRAAGIDDLAAKVKVMDYPAERKAVILASIEEFRRFATDPALAEKDKALLLELRRTDPELIGLNRLNTGHILKLYPNTVYLYKKRQTGSDGTVREIITGLYRSSVDVRIDIDSYFRELQIYNMNPNSQGEPPTPPAGVQFIDIYTDVPVENSIEGVVADRVNQLSNDPKSEKLYTVDNHEHNHGHDHKYQPDSSMLDASTAGTLLSLPEGTDTIKPDITREGTRGGFFEQLTDDELKQFLEMSDAQLAVELEKLLAPKLPLVEDIETQLREQSVDRSMTKHISPERFAAAQEILNRYGREEGLLRLRASDPEAARQMEQMRPNGPPSNPEKAGKRNKPE